MRKNQKHTKKTKDKIRRKLIGISIKNFHKDNCNCSFCKGHLGEDNWKYKKIGFVKTDKYNEYKYIKVSEGYWQTEHRYLVEQYIGYKLHKGWVVHHIDSNGCNNELSNLYIFKDAGLHRAVEYVIKSKLFNIHLKSNLKEFKRE